MLKYRLFLTLLLHCCCLQSTLVWALLMKRNNLSSEMNGLPENCLPNSFVFSKLSFKIKWICKLIPPFYDITAVLWIWFVDSNADGSMQMHHWFVCGMWGKSCRSAIVVVIQRRSWSFVSVRIARGIGPFLVSLTIAFFLVLTIYSCLLLQLSDMSYQSEEYEKTNIPQLLYNPNGWQKTANLLALSIPPPVGFSYCTPPGPEAQVD